MLLNFPLTAVVTDKKKYQLVTDFISVQLVLKSLDLYSFLGVVPSLCPGYTSCTLLQNVTEECQY